jgi:hypothetical protein
MNQASSASDRAAKDVAPPESKPASTRTHADDFAIVIGINHYPEHRALHGAVEDAMRFSTWLCEPEGGGLNVEPASKRVWIVTSTPDPSPEQKHVDEALEQIVEAADRNGGGRRLYFYFSGHGAAAIDAIENVALLLANWSRKRARLGLSCRGYADDLTRYGLFEEIAFFLDCCRTESISSVGLECTLTPTVHTPPFPTRKLIAYATEAGHSAFERPEQYLWHGVFTRCLLDIFRRGDGGVLASELKDRLECEITERRQGQQAHVDNSLLPGSRFGRAGAIATLEVMFRPESRGVVQLFDGSRRLVGEYDAARGPWRIVLKEGHLYKLSHPTTGKTLIVDFKKGTSIVF